MTKDSKVTEMSVSGILLDPVTQAPVVILETEDGKLQLPIWIGMAEATSIAASLKKLELNRPLTHDLIVELMGNLNVTLEQVMITDLNDHTYFAELVFSVGERAIILDARPSDAIAVSLRSGAPIYVNNKVIEAAQKDKAAQKLKQKKKPDAKVDAKEASQEETHQPTAIEDLRYVDKSKWADILKDLSSKDFKYEA